MAYKPSRKKCVQDDTVQPVPYKSNGQNPCCGDRAEYLKSERLDDKKDIREYDNPNHFLGGNSLSHFDRSDPIVTKPQEPVIHPIVNLCQPYIETVFFQYDCFPLTNAEMTWHNDKIGRIVGFTYYLDESAGDDVTTYIEKIGKNNSVTNLLNTPQNGNNYIKGTFNSTVLDFKCNLKIGNDDAVRVRFINASASDVTIMAKMEIKYGEEDFFTK
jgi:hypothetical protein